MGGGKPNPFRAIIAFQSWSVRRSTSHCRSGHSGISW